ncbi:hypothetical protein NQ314_016243 [Rhamnusium bicolor]|uniref:Uncharacterized protein n=1 Tax=Rhamnusium bicolor TaxID=1586634 RepID=A0AAV8WWS6_9CUCU|nr:hypothetical protein NQ314_016243 [Rhamnusium bicolor]
MHSFLVLLVNILLIFNVFCKNVQHRDPRFLRGTHTTTINKTHTVTKTVPSSCVQVDATLPPCRNVRFMRFPSFNSNEIDNDDARPQPKSEPSIYITTLNWAEYFGVYAPTATVNVTTIETTVVQDPRIVVSFAVKGCRPIRLPMSLSR